MHFQAIQVHFGCQHAERRDWNDHPGSHQPLRDSGSRGPGDVFLAGIPLASFRSPLTRRQRCLCCQKAKDDGICPVSCHTAPSIHLSWPNSKSIKKVDKGDGDPFLAKNYSSVLNNRLAVLIVSQGIFQKVVLGTIVAWLISKRLSSIMISQLSTLYKNRKDLVLPFIDPKRSWPY